MGLFTALAIGIHNFPEGLATFTAALNDPTLGIPIAVAIAIHNIPEGIAVSLPLRREGMSPFKSFWYGQLSAIVEPIGGVIGVSMVLLSKALLPYALSFAAGAMIFVVIEELIPESQSGENGDIATTGAIIGFVVMMILDLALS